MPQPPVSPAAFAASSLAFFRRALFVPPSKILLILGTIRPSAGSIAEFAVSASSEMNESTGTPPHAATISPTGTRSFAAISRAKKYPTAEICAAVSGVHSVHVFEMSFNG